MKIISETKHHKRNFKMFKTYSEDMLEEIEERHNEQAREKFGKRAKEFQNEFFNYNSRWKFAKGKHIVHNGVEYIVESFVLNNPPTMFSSCSEPFGKAVQLLSTNTFETSEVLFSDVENALEGLEK